MNGRAGNTAAKYLRTQSLLTCAAFGAMTVAGFMYPAGPNSAVAMTIGLVLGYQLRDAVGDWRGQRALAKLRKRQADATAELLARAQAGVMTPEDTPPWMRHTDPAAQPQQPPQEENTTDGN